VGYGRRSWNRGYGWGEVEKEMKGEKDGSWGGEIWEEEVG
jgi:hypothetical protein